MKSLVAPVSLIVLGLLGACKNPQARTPFTGKATAKGSQNQSESVALGGAWKPVEDKQTPSDIFNLAQFVKAQDNLSALHSHVAEGNAYLFFGDEKKFRTESNFVISADASQLDPAAERMINAQYWLDAHVFGQKLGNTGKGYVLDLGANANLDKKNVEAYIRFLGDDKYKGSFDTALEKNFVRDLTLDVPYPLPVPGLGLKVSGLIGGEIGIRSELGVRRDNAIQLAFVPKISIHAGLSGGIEVLKFVEAKAVGLTKLMEVKLLGSANLGVMPESEFSYGNVGVDAGELTALDGKITLVAKAEFKGILPFGIDQALWKPALDKLGVEGFEWSHDIFDPAPILVKELPGYGKSFMAFYKKPKDLADCKAKQGEIQAKLSAHKESISLYKDKLPEGLEKNAAELSLTYLGEIEARIGTYCDVK